MNRMKRKTLFLSLIFGAVTMLFSQNTLRVTVLSGADYEEALSVIGRMTVSDGILRIYAHDGVILTEKPLYTVGKITFGDGFTGLEQPNKASLRVYPNPAQDILYVDGLSDDDAVIRIFSIDGNLLETVPASDEQVQIQVGSLPRGVYLLQAGTNIIRFIKE